MWRKEDAGEDSVHVEDGKDTEELEGGRTFSQNSQELLFFAEYISQERYN